MITAALIDSREPEWVQRLSFGGVPTVVQQLEAGDVHAVTDDGCVLMIERKTPDDFLNSLQDERLFVQLARLVEARLDEQAFHGKLISWPYLMITGQFQRDDKGKVVTGRNTNWSWDAIQGALLTIQEMGVFVAQCGSDYDFEAAIVRLSNRKREAELKLLPPRTPNIMGAGAAILAALPGVGVERVTELLRWAGNSVAFALVGITDMESKAPLGEATRRKIRQVLGLADRQYLDLWANEAGDTTIKVFEKVSS